MRLGIYVGSFNPVHKGHIHIIDFLINNNYVDKIIVIPTGVYWDKQDLISINDRINMLTFYENQNTIIDTKLGKWQYTYQVLRELKKIYPQDNLYLIIGADNIINFDKWKNYQEILQNNLIVLPRDGIDISKYLNKLNQNNSIIVAKNFQEKQISSTEIRNLIKEKQYQKITDKLDQEVLSYIQEKQLYM